ncbi:hypothetical protein BIW11_04478 [Tropilaelaps mercedesae]|uniref:Uncharacterized protein n=1 Tax=Tropilaelaps mercedesae TaxID=418985 RepID=A0A1V9X5J8_9ACAR|nr:hypothetical protein BIW11_04478 [Tropilaelaps mercedesae]
MLVLVQVREAVFSIRGEGCKKIDALSFNPFCYHSYNQFYFVLLPFIKLAGRLDQ